MSSKATLAYWTPARMRAAKPADVITAKPTARTVPATGHPTGKPSLVAGGLPSGASASPVTYARQAARPGFIYPFPYDSFTPTRGDWKNYPYEVNGKIFFTNDGVNYVCSGTAIPSAAGTSDENQVWTAGHCLANTEALTGVADSSLLFIPAYNGHSTHLATYAPHGEFTWTGAWETTTAWLDNRDLSEDEATFTVGTNAAGQTLGNAVGWDGFAYNESVNEQFVAFGYPQAAPYNGEDQIEDIGATAGQDGNESGGANPVEPIVIGNPMTGGSSGGAWNIDWSTGGPGYVDGHNDYVYTNQANAMYSPYQDSLSNVVRCFGASSC